MRQYDDQGATYDEITTRLPLSKQEASDPQGDAASALEPPYPPAERADSAGRSVELPPPLPPVVPVVDEIPTPPYLPVVVAPPPSAQGRQGRGVGLSIAALICSLLALAVTGLLTWRLSYVGQGTLALLDGTISQLESVCGEGAKPFTFVFSETVRFKGEVPLPEGLVFPFKGNIPINTVVRIEVTGFPGTPTLEVPINTTVPIDTKVPIPGGIKIPIDTAVPVRQEIPINLCGDDSPLAGFLERTIEDLRSLRDLMRFP